MPVRARTGRACTDQESGEYLESQPDQVSQDLQTMGLLWGFSMRGFRRHRAVWVFRGQDGGESADGIGHCAVDFWNQQLSLDSAATGL